MALQFDLIDSFLFSYLKKKYMLFLLSAEVQLDLLNHPSPRFKKEGVLGDLVFGCYLINQIAAKKSQ